MSYLLFESNRKDKKYMIITPKFKVIHFGQRGADDFTTTNDEKKKDLYLKRHVVRENWSDPNTAGFWSRFLLWHKKTLIESIADIEKRFGLRIESNI